MSPTIASQFLTIQNIHTNLLSAGESGAPVLLLHGGGVDSARLSWGAAIQPLAESCRVFAPDWPGYGDSERPDIRYGMDFYRAKSILRVSQAFSCGFDEMALRSQPRLEQRKALLSLYGVGPASAGYILYDVFHCLDEMDHISPWEQKIYSKLFFDVDPEQPVPVEQLMALFDQRFGGYRALAVHYIWEDLFWKRKNENIPWLEKLIHL